MRRQRSGIPDFAKSDPFWLEEDPHRTALSFGAFKLLSRDCASALGGALARRIGPSLGVSKHARRNLSRAFPEFPETEIARVVAGMWDNLTATCCRSGSSGLMAHASGSPFSRRCPWHAAASLMPTPQR
jgi:lauroyl/myristoyl acyltransferase